ncbi:Putative YbiA-like superfamily protein [Septoria linicola]|uniref:YbiA-like superfamily protein n=1 Tax=Septoria linicola TaxID=215465 RepID=A0A9Q9EHS6_9PEZI|nr:putative YbiA-like superfamily protein [Septoria linicola]USW50267.1 Putative YbiA-like superfamily protein [Septoria linicola]
MGRGQKQKHQQKIFYTSGYQPSDAATTSDSSSDPVFFWKEDQEHGYLCQWYKSAFTDPSNPSTGTFNCAEQWMMYGKAIAFGDQAIAAEIMKCTSPRKQKVLGQQVPNFNEAKWNEVRDAIVERGNYLKFTQCTDVASMKMDDRGEAKALKEMLLATGDRELVEASPFDKIWGIGFDAERAVTVSRAQWGQNLLGKALMKVRDTLREELEGTEAAAAEEEPSTTLT